MLVPLIVDVSSPLSLGCQAQPPQAGEARKAQRDLIQRPIGGCQVKRVQSLQRGSDIRTQ